MIDQGPGVMVVYYIIWLAIGLILGLGLLVFARRREHADEHRLLGAALVIAAVIYVPFALLWGNLYWIFIELAGVALYAVMVWFSYAYSPYWLALGWLIHPVWDISLHLKGPGTDLVPEWYAIACVSFDVLLAVYIITRAATWMGVVARN